MGFVHGAEKSVGGYKGFEVIEFDDICWNKSRGNSDLLGVRQVSSQIKVG